MPVSASQNNCQPVRITLSGHYSFEEALEAIGEVAVRVGREQRAVGLLDITQSEETRTSGELRLLARYLGRTRAFARFVVVAASDVQYGLARMLSAFSEGEGLEVLAFRTEDEALAWLEPA